MSWKHLALGIPLFALLFFTQGVRSVSADIYCYEDENGVLHFTNVRTDSRYRIFSRSARRTPAQYIEDFADIIRTASRKYQVDPCLIKAIIKAESDFDHMAVSHKGAQGLMQLMPQTAADMAVQDPFDPKENILGGTRYFSMLLKRFKNDRVLALAAYNAGPERVESCRGVPPFPETEDFVDKVLAYYRSYNSRPQ
ncbi:MAG: lytic transglycosylase domain-containing protein [Deltaproteobacteria bacterium]|nr:lytic transglycosylase domain-containing protein [Deltaproteobacteria bacterium]MCF8119718.1 lytic transglycosylase domain-containing protein [Deltaproteobacteria bacterium]